MFSAGDTVHVFKAISEGERQLVGMTGTFKRIASTGCAVILLPLKPHSCAAEPVPGQWEWHVMPEALTKASLLAGDKIRATEQHVSRCVDRGVSADYMRCYREGGILREIKSGPGWTSLRVEHASGRTLWMMPDDVEVLR